MTWDEVINNPLLQNLPFKIELNGFGQILMSPASNEHGAIQFEVGQEMARHRKKGKVITECSIETSDGVKVADVVWMSEEFFEEYGLQTPYPKAPELCVEIVSPSNSKREIAYKVDLYLAKGAQEVWAVSEERKLTVYTHTGVIKKSKLVPKVRL